MNIRIATRKETFLQRNPQAFSFINPYSLSQLQASTTSTEDLIFGVDGGLLASLLSILQGEKIDRISFDNTSLAGPILSHAQQNKFRVALIGGSEADIDGFEKKILNTYPGLHVAFKSNGYYPPDKESTLLAEIARSRCDLLICSLGAVKQENFIIKAFRSGFEGTAYTCGGFFRQHASTKGENYYPKLIDKLNLRWAYRMYKEPHTIRRYLLNYPVSIIKIAFHVATGKLKIELIK